MATTILAQQVTTWRRTESKLRTLRVNGTDAANVAAINRAEASLRDLAHTLDVFGHATVAGDLAREAVLVSMVASRRRAGVSDPDINARLTRIRARIRAAR